MQGTTDILGHERTIERLWSSADRDVLHHAYLFEGPKGIGKHTLALRFAMAVNCEREGPRTSVETPCGACDACTQILMGNHPDVITVEPDPDRAARIISVESIREIVRQAGYHRFSARQRFILIDPADAMLPAASNALLKTLEEPPRDTGFVLISSKASVLLPTILSRCQRIRLGAIPVSSIEEWLGRQGMEATLARRSALLSQGCPGVALSLADGGLADHQEARDQLLRTLTGTTSDRFAYVEKLTQGARTVWMPRAERVLGILEELLRDVTVISSGSPLPLLHEDCTDTLTPWGGNAWPTGLATCVDAVHETRARLAGYANGRLVLDALLATLTRELAHPH